MFEGKSCSYGRSFTIYLASTISPKPCKSPELIQTTFKLIRFTGQCALGDIDFLCSLPCGFVEQDEGSDLLI